MKQLDFDIKTALAHLLAQGFVSIRADFSGSDGDGDINEWTGFDKEENALEVETALSEELEDWCYDYIDRKCPIDWKEGERGLGGSGELTINTQTGEIKLESRWFWLQSHEAAPVVGKVDDPQSDEASATWRGCRIKLPRQDEPSGIVGGN